MSAKYAFAKPLKELRFLFCQTSEASAPVRYVFLYFAIQPSKTALLVRSPRWMRGHWRLLREEALAAAAGDSRDGTCLSISRRSRSSLQFRFLPLASQALHDGRISLANSDHRNFLVRAYPTMKKNNPNIPIMMREAAGTVPKVFARYGTLDNTNNTHTHTHKLLRVLIC